MRIGIDHPERVGAFAQSVIADYRDHPVNTRLGWYAEVQVVEGFPAVGGAYTFQQVVPELRGFWPIGDVTIAARARAGAIRGEVPPTERFYAGGATSQRGFSIRRLSPSVTGTVNDETLTVPYGGTAMLETSIEARIPLTSVRRMPVGAVVFLDGGDVTEEASQLSLADLHWAAGFGLRVKTLVGPVRADFGYRLNRKGALDPEPGSSFAIHLSLGEAF
jgi:outer membrane translocation and assembly module TamA